MKLAVGTEPIAAHIVARFWSKVNKIDGGCWLWKASTVKGYGQFNAGVGRGHVYAHRFAYELTNRPIRHDDCVLHHCDTPACVRPDHLFLGTRADNLADARKKGRLDESRPRVHKLTPAQRLEIFHMPARHGLGAELARRYGVSETCICLIRQGRFAPPFQRLDTLTEPSDNRNQLSHELSHSE